MTKASPEEPAAKGPRRWALQFFGMLLIVLASVGAFLPILPTTPFLILAAACFARSSPRLRERLFANKLFGPYLSSWQLTHTIPKAAKRKAYGLVLLSFSLSIYLVESARLAFLLALLGLALIAFLARLPSSPSSPEGRDKLD